MDKKLQGVNSKLVAIVELASKSSPFVVVEGIRTVERQKELVAKGASKTMNSKHLVGRAVDLAPTIGGQIRWDWPLFYPMAEAVKDAAKELGITIVWGGDWKTFKDGPHFELGDNE
jgi:peptidoglycan L-alanyl-D-glutamate endopeptidase CwlK